MVAALRDPVEGLILLTGALALVLGLANRPLPPTLEIYWLRKAEVVDHPVLGLDAIVQPIAEEEVVEEQLEAAWETIPAPPPPPDPRGIGAAAALQSRLGAIASSRALFVSEESRREFAAEVNEYEDGLRGWLAELEHSRAEQRRMVTGAVRVAESGGGAADHVRVRLRFPAGFDLPAEPTPVGQAPERPDYEDRYRMIRPIPRLDALMPVSRQSPPWQGGGVRYSQGADSQVVIETELGHVSAGDYVDSTAFYLRAAPPGEYEVEWQLSGAGLRRPLTGRLPVQVAVPVAGEQIQTLRAVEAERKRCGL